MNGFKTASEASASGALKIGQTIMRVGQQLLENTKPAGIELNANLFSSVYGAATSVQPPSTQVLMIIKV